MGDYSMTDLLQLVYSEKAEELLIHAGMPPAIVVRGAYYTAEGPALTNEEMECLFLNVSNPRQRRTLRERGFVKFIYNEPYNSTLKGTEIHRANYLICARMHGERIEFDVSNLVSR